VLEAVGAQGLAKSKLVIFTALLRLRQICCDLRLLKISREVGEDFESAFPSPPSLPSPTSREISGKVEAFDELLQEIVDGGHRVLVFSQFTSMLALLKEKLNEQQIEFCYLDGSTANRGEVVEKFQRGIVPVFLIRCGFESHGRGYGDSFRPVVESSCGRSGDGSRASHRADARRDQL
jgi:non-specific serine/threonine protein kinase